MVKVVIFASLRLCNDVLNVKQHLCAFAIRTTFCSDENFSPMGLIVFR